MNNLLNERTARLELKYKLEASANQGDLRTILGTALELQHIAGILPHSIEYVTFTDDGAAYEFIDFHPADIRKLLAGKMTEIEYFARHRLTKLS